VLTCRPADRKRTSNSLAGKRRQEYRRYRCRTSFVRGDRTKLPLASYQQNWRSQPSRGSTDCKNKRMALEVCTKFAEPIFRPGVARNLGPRDAEPARRRLASGSLVTEIHTGPFSISAEIIFRRLLGPSFRMASRINIRLSSHATKRLEKFAARSMSSSDSRLNSPRIQVLRQLGGPEGQGRMESGSDTYSDQFLVKLRLFPDRSRSARQERERRTFGSR